MKRRQIAAILAASMVLNLITPVYASDEVLIIEDAWEEIESDNDQADDNEIIFEDIFVSQETEAESSEELFEENPEETSENFSEEPSTEQMTGEIIEEETEEISELFLEEMEIVTVETEEIETTLEFESIEYSAGPSVTWSVSDNGKELYISGSGAMNEWDGEESVPPWYNENEYIETVIIEEGITTIGACAFEGMAELTEVQIPDTVTRIGWYSFAECTSLTELTLPESLLDISDGAFYWCDALETIEIPASVRTIGASAFERTAITSVTIPKHVTEIADATFMECYDLTSVTFPDDVSYTYFGNDAFNCCSSLEEIKIPEGIPEIGDTTFYECSSLTNLIIPASVEEIGYEAFGYCYDLSEIHFKGNMPSFDDTAFAEDILTVYYPGGNVSWEYVLENETPYFGAEEIDYVPEGIVWNFEDGILTISSWTMEQKVFEKAEDAPWYKHQADITKIIIEDDVEKIDNYAFYNMNNARAVWFEGDGIGIGSNAFFGVTATAFLDYDSLWSDVMFAQYGGALNWIRWKVYGEVLSIEEKVNCNIATGHEEDTPWSGNYDITRAVLKEGVTRIDRYWFYDCYNLEFVEWPSTVTSIENYAFSNCESLYGIKIPDSVTEIGINIFEGCTDLKHIVFEGMDLPVMEANAFGNLEVSAYYKLTEDAYTKAEMNGYGKNASWIGWKVEEITGTNTIADGNKKLVLDGYGVINDFENPAVSVPETNTFRPWDEMGMRDSIFKISVEGNITGIGSYSFYKFIYASETRIGSSVRFIRDAALAIVGSGTPRGYGGEIFFSGDAPDISEDAFGDAALVDETLEEINSSAYIDVYYNKNCSGWSELIEKEFENTYVSWIYSDEVEVFEGGWKTTHTANNFAVNGNEEEGHYLSKSDETILFSNLSKTEKNQLKSELLVARYNLDGANKFKLLKKWKGSCYGLAHIIALYERGVIPDVWSGTTNNNVSNETKSLISFYYMQQFLPQRMDIEADFMKLSQEEQLTYLLSLLEKDGMLSLGIQYPDTSHAILAYGVEKGKFRVGDKWYNHRVLIYDVNENGQWMRGNNYHTHAMYLNDDTAEADQWVWTIPVYEIVSTTNKMNIFNKNDNAKLKYVSDDLNYMNAVDHNTGNVNISSSETYSYMHSANANATLSSGKNTYQFSNGLIHGQYAEDGDMLIISDISGADNGGFTVVLPENDGVYKANASDYVDFSVLYQGNSYLTAKSEQGGQAIFSQDGSVELALQTEGSGSVSVVSDDTDISWDKMTITAEDVSNLKAELTEEGIVVTGDNLYNLTIDKEENDQMISDTYSSENSVLITSESNRLVVKFDSNQDGTFDTDLNPHTHAFAGMFKWDASNGCKLMISCSGCDFSKEVACTIKEETVKEASCTEKGKTTYTASAVFDNKTYTDSRSVDIPVKEHNYNTPVFEWSSDNKSASAVFKCTAATHKVTCALSSTTTAASCTSAGKTTYTASVIFNNTNYTDSRNVSIPAKGHTYENSWKTTTAATAVSTGTQTRKCKYCDDTLNQSVDKLKPTMTLNASSLVLKVKQKTTALKVTELAAGDSVASYTSSNKKIFTVSKTGKITAKNKVGSAKLTITLASGYAKTINVKVQKAAVTTKKITGVQKNLTMKKGAKITLQPVLNPITSSQKITYSTSNKKIATVNAKGMITAKKKGTANITVKSGKKKVTVKVKVK